MWLLNTVTFQLVWFDSPQAVGVPYAILSHVWQGDSEQTFQDLVSLMSSASPDSPSTPRPGDPLPSPAGVSDKIKECCARARKDGYSFVWIDTCCINKTSSAELSEAINSMFDWYAKARVCYAYLHDVPPGDVPAARSSAFRTSAWFTRGWTLQELVAPLCLVFLYNDWTWLGTKASLAAVVEEITGVDASVLTFRHRLEDVSVARRMSWAAQRKTRRVEDEAYCLMGLFGVNMPTIYGEGTNAFRRLQEEILKHSPDQTLFAWGDVMPQHIVRENLVTDTHSPGNLLFAPSPAAFAGSARMMPISAADLSSRTNGLCEVETDFQLLPEFTLTSHGARCRLPLIDAGDFALAVLACQDTRDSCVGLILRRRRRAVGTTGTALCYLVGAYFTDDDQAHIQRGTLASHLLQPRKTMGYRLMRLTHAARSELSVLSQPVACGPSEAKRIKLSAQQTQVYIAHRALPDPYPWLRLSEPLRVEFQPWFTGGPSLHGFALASGDLRCGSWTPSNPSATLSLVFAHSETNEAFTIHLGQCSRERTLWASVVISPPDSKMNAEGVSAYSHDCHPSRPLIHPSSSRPRAAPHGSSQSPRKCALGRRASTSAAVPPIPQFESPIPIPTFFSPTALPGAELSGCATYHVGTWRNGSRVFGDGRRTVRLTVSRWPRDDTYSLDVMLDGSAYVRGRQESPGPPHRHDDGAPAAHSPPDDAAGIQAFADMVSRWRDLSKSPDATSEPNVYDHTDPESTDMMSPPSGYGPALADTWVEFADTWGEWIPRDPEDPDTMTYTQT